MAKKIIRYFFLAVLAVFLIWQGIFWTGECVKIYKYYSVFKKAGMVTQPFWSSVKDSSKKMPLLGTFLRYYDYQDYVVREEFAGRVPLDWKVWNADWLLKRPQVEETLKQIYVEVKARLDAEKADIYGGETPEETWAMFLDALKKEDFELASKYFVADKQADYLDMFKTVKEKGYYDEMMADLTISELDEVQRWDTRSEFVVGKKNEVVRATVIFFKRDNKWKIDSI
jgi:hypothetical protein